MKLLLILAVTLLGQVAFSAKQKEGGNCGILAGTYEGYYSWKDLDGMCLYLWLNNAIQHALGKNQWSNRMIRVIYDIIIVNKHKFSFNNSG